MCSYRSSLLTPLILVVGIGTALGQSAAVGTASAPGIADLSRFDGRYGDFETTQTSGKGCGAGHNHQMIIKDDQLSMSFNAMTRTALEHKQKHSIIS